MPNSRRVLLAVLVAAHLSVNLLWRRSDGESEWIWPFLFGVMLGQVTLVAMWYAWRAVSWLRRLIACGLLLAAFGGTIFVCLLIAMPDGNYLEDALFTLLLVAIAFVWQALVLAMCRKLWGHRLLHMADTELAAGAARRQFTLAEAGLGVSGLCFLLAASAPYITKLSNPGTGWELLGWLALMTMLVALVLGLAAAGLAVMAGWAKGHAFLLAWVVVAFLVSVVAGVFLQPIAFILVGELAFGILASIVPTLWALRWLGYRVERASANPN